MAQCNDLACQLGGFNLAGRGVEVSSECVTLLLLLLVIVWLLVLGTLGLDFGLLDQG